MLRLCPTPQPTRQVTSCPLKGRARKRPRFTTDGSRPKGSDGCGEGSCCAKKEVLNTSWDSLRKNYTESTTCPPKMCHTWRNTANTRDGSNRPHTETGTDQHPQNAGPKRRGWIQAQTSTSCDNAAEMHMSLMPLNREHRCQKNAWKVHRSPINKNARRHIERRRNGTEGAERVITNRKLHGRRG